MNQNVTFIISTMLDIYRPELRAKYGHRYKGEYSAEWSKQRIKFFRKWTLKSLHNQSFKDYTILMFCREESRKLIEAYEWDDNIRHCYDYGDQAFSEIDTEFVSITRMDTDDLFHRRGMELVAENFLKTKTQEKLLFSDYYEWLCNHGVFIHRLNPLLIVNGVRWAPGYTLILPSVADVKKKWFICPPDMCQKPHRVIGKNMICAFKIDGSTYYSIWNKKAKSTKELNISILRANKFGEDVIKLPETHIKILEDFGISKEEYLGV